MRRVEFEKSWARVLRLSIEELRLDHLVKRCACKSLECDRWKLFSAEDAAVVENLGYTKAVPHFMGAGLPPSAASGLPRGISAFLRNWLLD